MKATKTVVFSSGTSWKSDELTLTVSEWRLKSGDISHWLLQCWLYRDRDMDPEFEDTRVLLPIKYRQDQVTAYAFAYLYSALEWLIQFGTERQKENALQNKERLDASARDISDDLPYYFDPKAHTTEDLYDN